MYVQLFSEMGLILSTWDLDFPIKETALLLQVQPVHFLLLKYATTTSNSQNSVSSWHHVKIRWNNAIVINLTNKHQRQFKHEY